MLTLLVVVVAALLPLASVVGLLVLASHLQRRNEQRVAREAEVTYAIHRELGAVVAPVVEQRAWGPWRVRIPVPFDRPALVCSVLAVANRALQRSAQPFEIVLVPQQLAPARLPLPGWPAPVGRLAARG